MPGERNLARGVYPLFSIQRVSLLCACREEVFQSNTRLILMIIRALLCTSRRTIFIHFYTPILRSAEAAVYDAAMALRPFFNSSFTYEFVRKLENRENLQNYFALYFINGMESNGVIDASCSLIRLSDYVVTLLSSMTYTCLKMQAD